MERKKAEHQKAVVKKNHRTKAETREQVEGIQKRQKEVENWQEAHHGLRRVRRMGHRRGRNVNVSQSRATPPGHATINGIMTILLTDAALSVFSTVTEGVTQLVIIETNNIRTCSGNMV